MKQTHVGHKFAGHCRKILKSINSKQLSKWRQNYTVLVICLH